MKREDEEFCRMQFDTFVRSAIPPPEIGWTEVEQRDEPPDYYLYLDDARFAVEVTTLLEKVAVGTNSPLPPAVIAKILRRFVKGVESTAKAEGCLHGDYLVAFPTPIDDFSRVRREISANLLDYIRATAHLERSDMTIVFEQIIPQNRPQQCGIQKVGGRRDRVAAGTPFWFKWEGDAAGDLCGLLKKLLDTKIGKLRAVAPPKILLIRDVYMFADRAMYEMCKARISSLTSFHTVFIVQGSRGGFVLHSQRRDWSGQRLS